MSSEISDWNDEAASKKKLDEIFSSVPFYRENWKKYDPGEGKSVAERYAALPHLTKADMRKAFPNGLIKEGKDLGKALEDDVVEYTFTSGTTSEKVCNIFDLAWWHDSELDSWKLNKNFDGIEYPPRQAKLASSLNVGINCEEDLTLQQRTIGKTLYLNEKTTVLQWMPRHLRRMISDLNEYKPDVLEANPSLLARLSYFALDNHLEVFSPKVIVFTFEFPSEVSKRAIRKVFKSPFISSYGCTECGFVMESCEDGLLHQNYGQCRIDFRPLKKKYGGPDLGRIYVTTFKNEWANIVRFDVGDLVRIYRGDCKCGNRRGLVAYPIEGRVGNVTFDVRGGLVTSMKIDDSLAQVKELRDYHLEQETEDGYTLQVMLEPGSDRKECVKALGDAMRRVYGDGKFDIVVMDNILPGPAGKYRRTQCNFAFDEEALFE